MENNVPYVGRLEILGLHWTEKARIAVLKETHHAKEYQARVAVEGGLDAARLDELRGQRLEVTQRTPDRVAHRRAEKDRVRWIEFLGFETTADGQLDVRLATQHGTYVKEVLSGEGGNTQPSLASLLGRPCRCVELDVLAILDAEGKEEPVHATPPSFGSGL
jgi:tRNA pseudouridine synthase 10